MSPVYRFGPFELDPTEHRLLAHGQPVALTRRTFDTLLHLVRQHGRLVTRDELLAAVWGETIVEESNLHWTVSILRRALAEHSPEPWIETVRGVGYRFAATVTVDGPDSSPPEAGAPEATHGVPTSTPRRRSTAHAVRRFGWPLAILPVALIAWLTLVSPPWAPGHRPVVAVLDFRNLAPGAETDWLGTALTGLVSAELEAVRQLRAVPAARLAEMRRDLALEPTVELSTETRERIRRYLACDRLVVGSYLRIEGAERPLRLEVKLLDARSGETLARGSRTGQEEDLFVLAAGVADALRPALGLDRVGARAAYRMPLDPQARRFYAEGLELARRAEDSLAVLRLVAACEAEPEFALAWLELSKSYDRLGQLKLAGEAAAKARQNSAGLPDLSRLEIEANALRQERQWPEAITLYRRLWQESGDDPERGLELAWVQCSARQGAEALATLALLRKTRSTQDPRFDWVEAEAQRVDEHFSEVRAASRRTLVLARQQGAVELKTRAMLRWVDAQLRLEGPAGLETSGLLLESIRQNLEILSNPLLEAQSASLLGSIYRRLSRPAEALDAFERAAAIFRAQGARRFLGAALANVAAGSLDVGDLGASERRLREAVATCDEFSEADCRERFLNPLASNLLHRGQLGEARQLLAESETRHRQTGNINRVAEARSWVEDLEAWEGRLDAAVAVAREVLALRIEAGATMRIGWAHADLGHFLLYSGQSAEAENELRAGLQIALQQKAPDLEASARGYLALAALARGDFAAAEAESAAAYRQMPAPAQPITSFPIWLARCRVLLASQRLTEAETLISQGLGLAAKGGFVAFELEGRLLRVELARARGKVEEAQQRARELAAEARVKGFEWLAQRAEASGQGTAMERSPRPPATVRRESRAAPAVWSGSSEAMTRRTATILATTVEP